MSAAAEVNPASERAPSSWRLEVHGASSSIEFAPTTSGFELGRALLVERFAVGSVASFVSRQQAVIQDGAVGLILESRSEKNSTGLRRGGVGDWTWLGKGQRQPLTSGDHIGLDRKLKNGTILVLSHAAGPSSSVSVPPESVSPAATAAAAVPPAAPVCWFWQASGAWHRFGPDVEALLEAAHQRNPSVGTVAVDAQRCVDLRTMRQVRNDDPTKYRAVKREAATTAQSATASARASATAATAAFSAAPPAAPPSQGQPDADEASSTDGDRHVPLAHDDEPQPKRARAETADRPPTVAATPTRPMPPPLSSQETSMPSGSSTLAGCSQEAARGATVTMPSTLAQPSVPAAAPPPQQQQQAPPAEAAAPSSALPPAPAPSNYVAGPVKWKPLNDTPAASASDMAAARPAGPAPTMITYDAR